MPGQPSSLRYTRTAHSSKTGVFLEITGEKELAARLRTLDRRMESRGATSAVNKGLRVVAKAAKVLAPTKVQKQSIGTRNKLVKGQAEARVGVNLGKTGNKRKATAVPLTTGTRARFRKTVGGRFKGAQNKGTGRVVGSDFVSRALDQSRQAATQAMVQSVREFLAQQGAAVS